MIMYNNDTDQPKSPVVKKTISDGLGPQHGRRVNGLVGGSRLQVVLFGSSHDGRRGYQITAFLKSFPLQNDQ